MTTEVKFEYVIQVNINPKLVAYYVDAVLFTTEKSEATVVDRKDVPAICKGIGKDWNPTAIRKA